MDDQHVVDVDEEGKSLVRTESRIFLSWSPFKDIYSGHSGGEFLSKVKNREEFERGLEIRKGKGGKEEKKEKSDKKHFKIHL